jgi:hypothetical protein
MAKLSHRRTRRLAAALAAGAAALASPVGAFATAGESVDLIGTWYVLIHYTDDHAHDPTQMRWDEKTWVFERAGSRLRWTEYPIVVFDDQTGRFDRSQGRLARVLDAWEPNQAQLDQIAAGPAVNPRGSKSKMLRKRGDDDWRSATRSTAASASIVSYVENWSVENASEKPTFRREDILGSATTENLDGVTEYATAEVASSGRVLRGTFERDGSRHGTFRLMRSGSPRAVTGRAKRHGQRFYREDLSNFSADLARDDAALYEAIARRAQGAEEVSDEVRGRARPSIRAAIEKGIRDAGGEPREFRRQVDSLARQIEELVFDEGRSFEEVERLILDGQLNP